MRARVHNDFQAIAPGAVRQTLGRWLAGVDAASRILFSEPNHKSRPSSETRR